MNDYSQLLNGNIIKPQLNDKTIVAKTNNGYIDIEDYNATSIDASSQNGNLNINLLKGTLFKVDANTANGHPALFLFQKKQQRLSLNN
jgi:DUF4097 and DUF4098 domain-containing protein YvlB